MTPQGSDVRRVLVIDDEEDIATSLRDFLMDRLPRTHVTAETNPLQAVETLSREPFDMVIADFKMPNMTGVELLRVARQLLPRAWRVLATAYPASTTTLNPDDLNVADRVFVKPLQTEPFVNELRKLLDTGPRR